MKAGWEEFERLRDSMGADELVEEFARALSETKLKETCEYIARCHDIDL